MDFTSTLLRCFGDSSRRRLLRLLGEAPLTVSEMVEVLQMPQSSVSRHLKALRETGLVLDRREGNRIYSALVEPAANGSSNLSNLLNRWLREQPLEPAHSARLRRILQNRNGEDDGFQRLAHQWDELRRQYFGTQFHLEALGALLPPEWHVLDIGTGTGYLLPALSRQFSTVTAVDPSAAMLGLARQRARQEKLENVDFKFGQLEELPLESQSVDAALAILVLHHASDLEGALQELRRVLRPGGRLLVVDLKPHRMEGFQRLMADPRRGLDDVELEEKMEDSGFKVKQRRDLAPPPPGTPEAPEKTAPELFLLSATAEPRK